jgi:hypothetical protein
LALQCGEESVGAVYEEIEVLDATSQAEEGAHLHLGFEA